ncbi:glucosamine-6-phosphate deaminase [Actinopolymorpha cephalotaxi]|uniref:Glucosamine-6-phosphate deaminase n=1 Tax=Actinopolymorpha cephalotaxi TaxID=504797 RepID=A0A1I2QYH0_9ACTN|nr:glucosamine-6-phosphate deaminase [Actinopolymorpha cephalotaxi]NYH82447.1 glucosamine-6-phosphate deaminase [Actinopolymorpha cephalotaxi]SFG32773.1 glucosamine-6-phosphate deaminase [Actinopolymorpha cephalotaxi]
MTEPIVRVFPDRASLGYAAAADIAAQLRERLNYQNSVRMVFAAAPSQQETLDALVAEVGIDWTRVTAFQMDDYIGLPQDAPQRFGQWLRRAVFDRVPFKEVHLMRTDGDPEQRAQEYADLLAAEPIDLVCLGIGVNGHIAFNDPPVADFADPAAVKVVELDDTCRQQQVDDGCFPTFDDVPPTALTLTVPRLLDADQLFCVVPGQAKADAVRRTLNDPIGEACPATALRTHRSCVLYLDQDSAGALD